MGSLLRCLLLSIFVSHSYVQATSGFCEGLECESKEHLLQVIRHLQEEKQQSSHHYMYDNHYAKFYDQEGAAEAGSDAERPQSQRASFVAEVSDLAATAQPQCNICNSNPCLNGGTCKADSRNPWSKYMCLCPDEFAGVNCEKNISCTSKSCGANADCYVSNHQTNCICKRGFSGNPQKQSGCKAKVINSCGDGDPHIYTFDRLYFDYQGTCPYVFSKPCTNLTNGYAGYQVVAKNELINGAHVAYVSEVEVTMYDQKVHIDGSTRKVYLNGFRISVPYYWPSKQLAKVSVTYSSNVFYVYNDQLVTVTFNTNGQLCIQVPDVPEFNGNQTLCGLAGNIDGNYKDDIVTKNGSVYPVKNQHVAPNQVDVNRALDTWITNDFLLLRQGEDKCVTGEQLSNNTNCDATKAVITCDPIKQAASGQGPFAACQPMGNDTIMNFYDNCVFDVCHQSNQKCNAFTNFVRTCMAYIPNTNLQDWRVNPVVDCTLTCPVNSHYASCKSSCPATCTDQSAPDFCDQGCSEGCECDAGFVLDTTSLGQVTCIRVESCGCLDESGNTHPADIPWLTYNCSIWNQCRNGTYYSKRNQCSQYGTCASDSTGDMACTCASGFTGDGYNCTDINECLDPATCSVNKGQGVCTNTIGSYNCTCNTYYGGRDCQYYLPRRHCADVNKYWGYTTTGVYTINPPYPFNGRPAFTEVSVYCDMTTGGGGWTLMSHDDASGMANKSLADYKAGFGDPTLKNVWLGLDIIAGMTNEVNTSLLLNLYRCPHNNLPALQTDCTYPHFSVDGSNSNYTVYIPQVCSGSEKEYYDGWARWDLSGPGPSFITYDNDNSNAECSATFRRTGWWFDSSYRCGAANLNGVRYTCDHIPQGSDDQTYLYWSGSPLGQAWLSLRPTAYPNYDPHPVTPVNWQDFFNN